MNRNPCVASLRHALAPGTNQTDILVGTAVRAEAVGRADRPWCRDSTLRFRLWRNVYSDFLLQLRPDVLPWTCVSSGLPSPAFLPPTCDHSKPGVIRKRSFPSSFAPQFTSLALSPRVALIAAAYPVPGGSFRPDHADGSRVVPVRTPSPPGSTTRGGRVRRPVSLPYRFRHA